MTFDNSEGFDARSFNDLLETARSLFRESAYTRAEPMLQQLALINHGSAEERAEIWHMMAVILYENGRFNKAIKTFRRALEILPSFTDASVGLSIILNDLGRYEEGRKVFEEAQSAQQRKSLDQDTALKERLAAKHLELADMYNSHQRWDEALDQLRRALEILPKKTAIRIKVVDVLIAKGDVGQAFKTIRQIVAENPSHSTARLKFGLMLFRAKRIADAIDQWETVLLRDPENPQALKYLSQARERVGDHDESLTEL